MGERCAQPRRRGARDPRPLHSPGGDAAPRRHGGPPPSGRRGARGDRPLRRARARGHQLVALRHHLRADVDAGRLRQGGAQAALGGQAARPRLSVPLRAGGADQGSAPRLAEGHRAAHLDGADGLHRYRRGRRRQGARRRLLVGQRAPVCAVRRRREDAARRSSPVRRDRAAPGADGLPQRRRPRCRGEGRGAAVLQAERRGGRACRQRGARRGGARRRGRRGAAVRSQDRLAGDPAHLSVAARVLPHRLHLRAPAPAVAPRARPAGRSRPLRRGDLAHHARRAAPALPRRPQGGGRGGVPRRRLRRDAARRRPHPAPRRRDRAARPRHLRPAGA